MKSKKCPCPKQVRNTDAFFHFYRLQQIGQLQHELFALFPAEAGVGDALAVGALADLLVAVLDVALDHHALDERVDVIRVALGVQDLLRDADLLQILLAGVGVVAVDDAGGVLDALFRVQLVLELADLL